MSTPKFIGHPDFIAYGSSPIPTLVAALGPFGAGQSAAQVVPMTSGGSYILAVMPDNYAHSLMTDVIVNHLDADGNVILSETYGAVPGGTFGTAPYSTGAPILLRGNIYGTTLSIIFRPATAAYMQTVLGIAGLTAANALCNVYVLTSAISDPDPKMSTSSPAFGTITGGLPQGLLAQFVNLALPISSNSGVYIIAPNSGSAKLFQQFTGPALIASDCQIQIRYYTVNNGTAALAQRVIEATAANIPEEHDIFFPCCLATIEIVNANGANAITATVVIESERQA